MSQAEQIAIIGNVRGVWQDKDNKRGTENLKKTPNTCQNTCKQSCSCYGSSHLSRQCLAYRKKCAEYGKVNQFWVVSRSGRNRTVHDLKQKPDKHHEEEDHIDMVEKNLLFSTVSSW